MANLRLKKLILEVVDNQLRENNPPVTKESYDKLIDAWYSAREAKEKIGAIVIEEIYDVMKENQPYDEKRYTQALRNMVQQCIDLWRYTWNSDRMGRMGIQQPIVKEKKVYPNDPCPCGSGKKYKKCCGRKK